MKEYLKSFMTEFEYAEEDISKLLDAYGKICGVADARSILEANIATYEGNVECDYTPIIESFAKSAELTGVHEYTVAFVTFLCFTRHAREVYRERGISDEVYTATMMDLKYKLRECHAVKGVCGTFVATWYPWIFRIQLFTLGRLQYHIRPLEEEYRSGTKFLEKGTPVLNIHIPADLTPLTAEAVQESFLLAREFFKEELGENPAFICRSWLLWPRHEEILKPTSNILAFYRVFEILDSNTYNGYPALRFIFDSEETNPDKLPADNSLRRAYVELLRRGEPAGWGYGIAFLNE